MQKYFSRCKAEPSELNVSLCRLWMVLGRQTRTRRVVVTKISGFRDFTWHGAALALSDVVRQTGPTRRSLHITKERVSVDLARRQRNPATRADCRIRIRKVRLTLRTRSMRQDGQFRPLGRAATNKMYAVREPGGPLHRPTWPSG